MGDLPLVANLGNGEINRGVSAHLCIRNSVEKRVGVRGLGVVADDAVSRNKRFGIIFKVVRECGSDVDQKADCGTRKLNLVFISKCVLKGGVISSDGEANFTVASGLVEAVA